MAKVHISPKNRKLIGAGLNAFISLGAIWWIVYALNWTDVRASLARVHYGWVVLGMATVMLNAIIRTLRWRVLLSATPLQFSPLFSALIIGQGANYILPARMGDVIRIYIIGNALHISKAQVLGTIALEKLWDTTMLVIFAAGLGWFLPLPNWLLTPIRSTAITVSGVLLAVAILLWRQIEVIVLFENILKRWLPKLQQRLVSLIQNILTGFAGLQSLLRNGKIGILSLLIWLLGGATNYFIFLAFDISLSYTVALVLLLALILGVAIPSLPGRVGVFEAICILVLTTFRISEGMAFSYALTMHITAMLPPLVMAIILGSRYNLSWFKIVRNEK